MRSVLYEAIDFLRGVISLDEIPEDALDKEFLQEVKNDIDEWRKNAMNNNINLKEDNQESSDGQM